MSDERFEDILESCLRMAQAGVSIDDCVARHPEHATGLREQLAAARLLAGRVPVRPEPAAVARSRAQLLGAVAQQHDAASGQEPGFLPRALRRLVVVPYALPAAAALVILGGAAFGVSAATGNPNPRDWFVASSSQTQIEIEGVLSAIDSDSLTVDTGTGLVDIAITPDTEFEGEDDAPATAADFAVGDFVKVHVIRGEDGSLTAREVDLAGPDDAPIGDDDGTTEDNSGPGSGDDDATAEDNSSPDSGDDDGTAEDNSGPGSGDDDATPEDNSGPGSSDDHDGTADDSSAPEAGGDSGEDSGDGHDD